MNFKLTEEQELIRKNMREFASKHVDPIAAEIDKNHRFPMETVQRMAELQRSQPFAQQPVLQRIATENIGKAR